MAEKQTLCCLRRLGCKTTEKALISLEDKEEVSMGRGLDCTVRLGASVMLSRKHAILKKTDGVWWITDNKSLNGVYVNSEKTKQNEPVMLKDSDEIQLGVSSKPGVPPEFVWRFHTSLKVKKMKPGAVDRSKSPSDSAQKRSRSEASSPGTPTSHPALKRLCQNTTPTTSPTAEYKKKLLEIQKEAEEKLKEQQRQLEEMKKQLEEKDKAREQMHEKLKEREEQLRKEVEKKQVEHEAEQERIKEELRAKYENELQEKEESLREKLGEERAKLEEAREDLELQLTEEMAKQINDRDQKLQEELLEQKNRLNGIIQEKEAQQKLLESQLFESRDAHIKAKEENALEVKEDVLKNFADLMETELQCSICSELFVQATSLNCSHSFCAYCIRQWMEVKKECPVCRASISSHLRSIVLDNYIDRMIDFFTDDMKEARKAVIEARKEEELKREALKKAEAEARAAANNPRRGRGGRRRGRARGRSGASRGRDRPPAPQRPSTSGQPTTSTVIDLTTPVRPGVGRVEGHVIISSSGSDSDSSRSSNSNSDSNSYNSNESDDWQGGYGYYGGFGRCYNCGRRGHWAHGCPN